MNMAILTIVSPHNHYVATSKCHQREVEGHMAETTCRTLPSGCYGSVAIEQVQAQEETAQLCIHGQSTQCFLVDEFKAIYLLQTWLLVSEECGDTVGRSGHNSNVLYMSEGSRDNAVHWVLHEYNLTLMVWRRWCAQIPCTLYHYDMYCPHQGRSVHRGYTATHNPGRTPMLCNLVTGPETSNKGTFDIVNTVNTESSHKIT